MPHGREYLLQAGDESEMNEWVSLINWSAASKTLGIPTTSLGSPSDNPQLSQPARENDQVVAEGRSPVVETIRTPEMETQTRQANPTGQPMTSASWNSTLENKVRTLVASHAVKLTTSQRSL